MLTESRTSTIRTAWFAIPSLCLVVGGLLLASWIGGREGLVVGLLLPAVLASIPTMLNVQFGQFHMMAMILAGSRSQEPPEMGACRTELLGTRDIP